MAKLIVKSPYIKCPGKSAGGYMKYIATRERVQKLPDERPPTQKQTSLVKKLLKDFPNLQQADSYRGYCKKLNRATASEFISTALESNWDAASGSDVYMQYIASRPRAEKLGTHGLFGDTDGVDLNAAMEELDNHTGNVWTHIISLHREDAERLGYNNANAWRNLIRAHRNEIAAAMKIAPNDFRWYAAFHDEGEHPHIHMMAWSAKANDGYLTRDGIAQIKSKLTNDIFKQEMLHLYEQKSVARDVLVQQARDAMKELLRDMRERLYYDPQTENDLQQLSQALETVKGKKQYGYLPKPVKAQVDAVVDRLEQMPVVADAYEQWLTLQGQVESYYGGDAATRIPLSQQKEFRSIKNLVVKEAEHIRLGEMSFEGDAQADEDELEQVYDRKGAYWQLRKTIEDEREPLARRDVCVESMEKLASQDRYESPFAQYYFGKLNRDGGLITPDWVTAAHFFEKSAQAGYLPAQYALGKLYLTNDPEVRNVQYGMEWLTEAARRGSQYAAYRLGKEYLSGKNVPQDTEKALGYFTASADAGNQYAQYMLGKLYLDGNVVPADAETALFRFGQSAEQGHRYALYFLERQAELQPPSVMLSVMRLLGSIGKTFEKHAQPKSTGEQPLQRKHNQALEDTRIALGHREDDHEPVVNTGPVMSM